MGKPYLTKVWLGRRWWYLHTRRSFGLRVGGRFGIVSYRRLKDME